MKQLRPVSIAGGRIVTPDGVRPGTVRFAEGLIAAVGDANPQDGDEVVDAAGRLVAPGLIDFGVFAIDKPAFHFGGIARAALMPDQDPPLDYPARVRVSPRKAASPTCGSTRSRRRPPRSKAASSPRSR